MVVNTLPGEGTVRSKLPIVDVLLVGREAEKMNLGQQRVKLLMAKTLQKMSHILQ